MKVYIESYGCAANMADSRLMVEILTEAGHEIVDSTDDANAIIINTCTVRLETEQRMVKRIKELTRLIEYGKKLIVAGCLAGAQPGLVKRISSKISMVSPSALERINDVVVSDHVVYMLKPYPRFRLPKIVDGVKITIPIAEGCLGSCTYCIVKVARGPLRSYDMKAILKTVKEAVNSGAKEIRLTAQDTASYGVDKGWSLPQLLQEICEIEGEFMVRVGMMNPDTAMKILDDLIEAYKCKKIYKFLHLPVQSGDNRILKLMKRKYTVEDFKYIINMFRKVFPEIFIATDIIVGFPTESEEEFQNTCNLLLEVKPDKVHVARYTQRPHTKAAAMPQIPEKIKKIRSRIASKIALDIGLELNKRLIDRTLKCLVVDVGARKGLEARTMNYKPVYFNGSQSLIGSFVNLRIVDAGPFYLIGEF